MRCWFLIALLPGFVLGDGIMFVPVEYGRTQPLAATPAQEALLIRQAGGLNTVVLRTHFSRGPSELAWLVPVPGIPTDVGPADESVFTALADQTAPRFSVLQARGKGMFSCGCAAEPSGEQLLGGVQVLGAGTAGVFQFHTLRATKADELANWLTANGYHVPGGAIPLLDRYVRLGHSWLAMKIRPDQSSKPTLAPHPIQYSYRSEGLVFPLVISRLTAAPSNELVLYVASDSWHRAGNWGNETIDRNLVRRQVGTASGTNYEALFREASARTAQKPEGRMVIEFAGFFDPRSIGNKDWPRGWDQDSGCRKVTRLRALLRPEDMDRDVELVAASEGRPVARDFIVEVSGHGPADVGTLLAFAAGCGVLFLPRRGMK